MAIQSINIKFPFQETTEGGVFATNISTENALRDDLVALLTLKRGQRPMQGNMFSPIFDYIDEPLDGITTQRLETDIRKKVLEYIPEIKIEQMVFTPQSQGNLNLLGISIHFSINQLFGATQSIQLNFPVNNNV